MLGLFKTVFFIVLYPFRAIYNWFFRRRIQKIYEPQSPVISPQSVQQQNSNHHIVDFDQSWNSDWGSMDTEQNASKIEQYRSQLIRQRSEPKAEMAVENTNFFADMEPQNVRQAKVFVGSNSNQNTRNRLSVSNDDAYQPTQDTVSFIPF